MQKPSPAVLYVYQNVSRDPREERELLLGEFAFDAQIVDPGTDLAAPPCPGGDPLWVVLARARRHTFQYSLFTP